MEAKSPFMIQPGSHTTHFFHTISQDRYKNPHDSRKEHKPTSQWRSIIIIGRVSEMEYIVQLSLENIFFEVLRLWVEPLFPGID